MENTPCLLTIAQANQILTDFFAALPSRYWTHVGGKLIDLLRSHIHYAEDVVTFKGAIKQHRQDLVNLYDLSKANGKVAVGDYYYRGVLNYLSEMYPDLPAFKKLTTLRQKVLRTGENLVDGVKEVSHKAAPALLFTASLATGAAVTYGGYQGVKKHLAQRQVIVAREQHTRNAVQSLEIIREQIDNPELLAALEATIQELNQSLSPQNEVVQSR